MVQSLNPARLVYVLVIFKKIFFLLKLKSALKADKHKHECGRRGGLMVGTLVSGWSGSGSGRGKGHYVMWVEILVN